MKQKHKHQPSLLLGTTPEGEAITIPIHTTPFLWVLGVAGSGKSTLLVWIILHLLRMGVTVVCLDPHGDTVRLVISCLSQTNFYPRGFDILQFYDFNRQDAYPAFNVLNQKHINNYRVAQNFLESIHRSFPSSSGTTANLDNTIEYSAFCLAENGLPITPYLQRFLLDSAFRNRLLAKIKDQQIVQFFDFTFSDKVNSTLIASTMRRLDLLTFSPILRASLGTTANNLSFRSKWDRGISCLISLSGLTENEKRLLGCLLLVSIEQHFLSRLELPPEKRSPVALIVDEAPLFLSQDETSLTTIIDQCRKAGAVATTFANQTLTQLSKGMSGSLQQALPVIFRAGTSDSSELVNRFFRVPAEQNESWLDLLSFTPRPSPGVFSTVKTTSEARMIFEGLKTAEAIVMLPGRAVKVTTPTISTKIDRKKLEMIEQEYARRLLTSRPLIEHEQAKSNLVLLSSDPGSVSLAKRRVSAGSVVVSRSLQFITGSLTDDLLSALFHLHYATLHQLCTLLDRESSINHVRTKLNSLKADGKVDSTTLPVTTGKPPAVWFLTPSTRKNIAASFGLPIPLVKGEKTHGYLQHTLACTDLAVLSLTLPQVRKEFATINFLHERTLKASPIKISEGTFLVPDGWVHLRLNNTEDIGIIYEYDRSTEEKDKILSKIKNHVALASGIYQRTFGLSSLSIAFCVEDDIKRVKQLVSWTEQALEKNKDAASLFLFGSVTPGILKPDTFFLDKIFLSPFDTIPHALLDM